MKNIIYWKILGTMVWVSLACFVQADTLVFNNGDRLTGKISKEEMGKIFFHSDLLGDMKIDASKVSLITRSEMPAVAEVEEQTVTETSIDHRSKLSEAGEAPVKSETKSAKTKKTSIKSSLLRFPGIGFLVEHRPLNKWDSDLKAGFGWKRGERDKVDITMRFVSIYEREKSHYKLNARYTYGFQKGKDGVKEKSSDRYEASLRYRYTRSERVFFQANSRYLKDLIKNINGEFKQSLGLGWKYLNGEKMQASITPSLTGQYQQIANVGKGWDFLATLFQDFEYKLSDKFTFREETVFSVDPGNTHLFTIDFLAKIEARISTTSNVDLRWEIDFDNNVAPGVNKLQERILLAFGYKF